jgi:type I restriction-modification system DNA methylase subunit
VSVKSGQLQHGFHFLKDEGVMAIILPHGVLFRGGAEERIRTKLLKDGRSARSPTTCSLSTPPSTS